MRRAELDRDGEIGAHAHRQILQAIARGDMDIALELAASDLLFVGKHRSFRIYPTTAAVYYAIILNLKDQVFKDIRIRKAIDHAIDRDSTLLYREVPRWPCRQKANNALQGIPNYCYSGTFS